MIEEVLKFRRFQRENEDKDNKGYGSLEVIAHGKTQQRFEKSEHYEKQTPD